jgi:hypothetical protein
MLGADLLCLQVSFPISAGRGPELDFATFRLHAPGHSSPDSAH